MYDCIYKQPLMDNQRPQWINKHIYKFRDVECNNGNLIAFPIRSFALSITAVELSPLCAYNRSSTLAMWSMLAAIWHFRWKLIFINIFLKKKETEKGIASFSHQNHVIAVVIYWNYEWYISKFNNEPASDFNWKTKCAS